MLHPVGGHGGLAGVRHLPAHANQRHQPELDLVPIGAAIDVDVIECDRRGPVLQAEAQPDAFIQDPAVTLGVSQRIGGD